MSEVVFEGEEPVISRRSEERILPRPRKDKGQTEKVVLGILGIVLITSTYIAINTRPKEVVLLSPLDQPVVTTAPN